MMTTTGSFPINMVVTDERNPICYATEHLMAHGLKFLGSGTFAAVYAKKGARWVYKVGEVEGNVGYLTFLRALWMRRGVNPWLPKIAGLTYVKSSVRKNSTAFVVKLERLTEGNPRNLWPHSWTSVVGEFEDAVYSDQHLKRLAPSSNKAKAARLLRRTMKWAENRDFGLNWDLHTGNIMKRGHQPVITDPFS